MTNNNEIIQQPEKELVWGGDNVPLWSGMIIKGKLNNDT